MRDATLSGATGRRRSLPTRRGERMTTPPPRVPCSQNTGNRAERETVAREEGTRPTQRQPDKREGREGSHFLTLPRPGITGHGSRRRVASRVGGRRSASRRSAVGPLANRHSPKKVEGKKTIISHWGTQRTTMGPQNAKSGPKHSPRTASNNSIFRPFSTAHSAAIMAFELAALSSSSAGDARLYRSDNGVK